MKDNFPFQGLPLIVRAELQGTPPIHLLMELSLSTRAIEILFTLCSSLSSIVLWDIHVPYPNDHLHSLLFGVQTWIHCEGFPAIRVCQNSLNNDCINSLLTAIESLQRTGCIIRVTFLFNSIVFVTSTSNDLFAVLMSEFQAPLCTLAASYTFVRYWMSQLLGGRCKSAYWCR